MAVRILPDVDVLRQCFSYDPETGVLTHKERPRSMFRTEGDYKKWTTRRSGKVAGTLSPKMRYKYIDILGINYLLHRVIYKHCTGIEPPEVVDHINQNKNDNRIENLRPASHTQNRINGALYKNSTTKIRGVSQRRGGFRANLCVGKKQVHLGDFPTREEAAEAYRKALKTHYDEFVPKS